MEKSGRFGQVAKMVKPMKQIGIGNPRKLLLAGIGKGQKIRS
jgi:hypothetical protein